MAREFSKSEIVRHRCSICGSSNKKFTELLYNGKMCGYNLTCCNCNHIDTFTDNLGSTTVGREVCIQITGCKNKCKYYRNYPLWYAIKLLERILNGLSTDTICDQNCGHCEYINTCPDFNKNNQSTNTNSKIENSDISQLDINGYKNNNPKFH